MVVPAFSATHPERTREPVEELVRSLHDEGIRYLLFAAGAMVQPLLACAIHQLGMAPRLLQVVVLGASTAGELSAFRAQPRCTISQILAVCENGGWIGVQACTASTYAEDDQIVNQATGGGLPPHVSQGLDGLPWGAEKTLVVPVGSRTGCSDGSDCADCVDDEESANTSPLLRRLLRKRGNERLSCEEVYSYASPRGVP